MFEKSKIMKCSISECKYPAIETVKISFRETRNLCKNHLKLYNNKNSKYSTNFKKASEI